MGFEGFFLGFRVWGLRVPSKGSILMVFRFRGSFEGSFKGSFGVYLRVALKQKAGSWSISRLMSCPYCTAH